VALPLAEWEAVDMWDDTAAEAEEAAEATTEEAMERTEEAAEASEEATEAAAEEAAEAAEDAAEATAEVTEAAAELAAEAAPLALGMVMGTPAAWQVDSTAAIAAAWSEELQAFWTQGWT